MEEGKERYVLQGSPRSTFVLHSRFMESTSVAGNSLGRSDIHNIKTCMESFIIDEFGSHCQ